MIFACVFSNNILSTVKSVIHFECNVQLVARMIQPRYAIHRFPRNVHLDARKIQPRYAIHRFPRSVQLVARMIHKGNETKCGDFCVSFFKQRIANRQECYSFRATSCTLRSTINPRTERYLTLFRHFRFRATSCTLRFWRGYKQRSLA